LKRFLVVIVLLFINTITVAQNKAELRGVWITNVDSDVLSTDERIADAMDYLAEIGVNVVFPVVWNKGYTIYPSPTMLELFGIEIIPQFANRDPLKKVILEAHRNGIEVIPWFEFGFSTSYSLSGGHIIAKYPDWALKNNQGNLVVKNGFDWMSGIHSGPQDFMLKLIMEVIDNYDIDGIQGDDRLPAMPVEGGYEDYTVQLYQSENSGQSPPSNYGNTQWMRWRADKLNDYMVRMRDSVKSRDTNLVVSSAPSNYPWGYQEYLQDTKTWVTDGMIDNFIPQLYRQDLGSYKYELQQAIRQIPLAKKKIFFSGVLAKVGGYVISPSLLLGSIQANRDSSIAGETFFFYEALRANDNQLGDTLLSTFYNEPALLPYRNGNLRRPKGNILNEDDSGVNLTGNWTQFPIPGFKPNILLTNDTAFCSIEYNFEINSAAYYDVYTYIVTNTPNTTAAEFTIFGDTDSTIVYVDQKNSSNRGWYYLGTVNLPDGNHKVVRLTNKGLESGKYITADASMLLLNRKLSPDVIVTGMKDKNIKNTNIENPENFMLSENYPNPFNPSTTIEINLNTRSNIKLEVFDILGRRVAELFKGEMDSGLRRYIFNGENLSSGVYLIKLSTPAQQLFRKALLVK